MSVNGLFSWPEINLLVRAVHILALIDSLRWQLRSCMHTITSQANNLLPATCNERFLG